VELQKTCQQPAASSSSSSSSFVELEGVQPTRNPIALPAGVAKDHHPRPVGNLEEEEEYPALAGMGAVVGHGDGKPLDEDPLGFADTMV
jgi:hypothetical protein